MTKLDFSSGNYEKCMLGHSASMKIITKEDPKLYERICKKVKEVVLQKSVNNANTDDDNNCISFKADLEYLHALLFSKKKICSNGDDSSNGNDDDDSNGTGDGNNNNDGNGNHGTSSANNDDSNGTGNANSNGNDNGNKTMAQTPTMTMATTMVTAMMMMATANTTSSSMLSEISFLF